jgi:hypothetical protein
VPTTTRTTRRPGPARRRLLTIASTAAAGVLCAGLATALPAAADTSAVVCTGTESITYSPGLTFTPASVEYTGADTYTSCISTPPADITSASFSFGGTATFSCTSFTLPSYTATQVVNWSDGQTSTWTYSTEVTTSPDGDDIFVADGTIVAGEFEGAQASLTVDDLPLNLLACLTPEGATEAGGPAVFEVA